MAVLLGLGAALGYGASDFLGGFASRRSGVVPTSVVSQAGGVALVLAVLAVVGESPTAVALAWGAGSGALAAVALLAYFRGLAIGRMGVVSPIVGVVAAAVPVLLGLALGERPSAVAMIGIGLAVVAVGLVSVAPEPGGPDEPALPVPPPGVVYGGEPWHSEHAPAETQQTGTAKGSGRRPGGRLRAIAERTPGLLEAVIAGLGFGLFFVLLGEAEAGGALWATAASAAGNLLVLLLIAAVARRSVRPAPGSWLVTIGCGMLSSAATLSFALAAGRGLVSIAAVLAALSPAATVALARVFAAEHLHRLQLLGLVVAVGAAALIAAG